MLAVGVGISPGFVRVSVGRCRRDTRRAPPCVASAWEPRRALWRVPWPILMCPQAFSYFLLSLFLSFLSFSRYLRVRRVARAELSSRHTAPEATCGVPRSQQCSQSSASRGTVPSSERAREREGERQRQRERESAAWVTKARGGQFANARGTRQPARRDTSTRRARAQDKAPPNRTMSLSSVCFKVAQERQERQERPKRQEYKSG